MDPREAGGGGMDRPFIRSRLRFASAMSSIIEKYNFPFESDMIVSIKSLTFETPNGPMVWGEETSDEITDHSYQNTVQCQDNIVNSNEELPVFDEETQQQLSDLEDEDYEEYQSSEEQFTNSYGENQLESPDHKNHNELASIKRHLENIHIKENIPLTIFESPKKNKCRVEMDILLEDGAVSVPKLFKVSRTKPKNFHQGSPLHVLEGESLSNHHSVVLRKEAQSNNGYSTPRSLHLYNSPVPVLTSVTTGSGNQSLWSTNETAHSSFVEMYKSANEQCSWNNVTIADLYPGMVKALSRLMHKASHKAFSSSLIKRYRHGHWQTKHGCLNTSTERIRKFRPLKMKTSLIVTKDDRKKDTLPMASNGSNSPLDGCNSQMECSVDRMEADPSDTVKDVSYAERAHTTETIIFPNNISTEETFLVKSLSHILPSSDYIRKGQSSEKNSSAICVVDSGSILLPAVEDKSEEVRTLTVKTASYLSLSLNSSTSSYLQNTKCSSVTTSDKLLSNHEIKTFSTTISLQRSHSLSSLPVSQSPIKAHQKYDDAFEKMYNELCSPKVQKPLPNVATSPRKSVFKSHSSTFHLESNEMFDNIYKKICSGRFLRIPTFLRAANLKKYEGIQMSETVNALVNSPIRTLPAVARIKRVANFCNEDVPSSPIKRFKNVSENSSRKYQKLSYWEKTNLQRNMTFTLHAPHLDSGFCDSSDCKVMVSPGTYMQETRTMDVCENSYKSLQSCGSLKLQSCPSGVSRKLNYTDRRVRDTGAYVEVYKDY